jgi:uncharacterized low-complexity protein
MTKPRKPLALSIGAAVVGSALTTVATADNPFGMRDLKGGYLQLASSQGEQEGKAAASAGDKAMEGKCGEGLCGANMRAGAKTAPAGEGDAKPAAAATDKAAEDKGGEGKCGSSTRK